MEINRGSKVQELYERCRMVFCGYDGFSPALEEIRWLQAFLGTMVPEDLGIDGSGVDDVGDFSSDEEEVEHGASLERPEGPMIPGRLLQNITYVHVHECDEFSIGVFCFPAGATLPLHDHPEMVVLSKVLYGSVVARAYDWVKPPDCINNQKCGVARRVINDRIMNAESPVAVLFPETGGNIHSFTALTPCAFLDVLSPPYDDDKGRPSTYFHEIPIQSLRDYAILKETGIPNDLRVVGAPYLGPELVVDDDVEDEEEHMSYY